MPKVPNQKRFVVKASEDPAFSKPSTRSNVRALKRIRSQKWELQKERSIQNHEPLEENKEGPCGVVLPCGHSCGGYEKEDQCPACIHPSCRSSGQTCEDTCVICYTERLDEAPVIQLECGHIFHLRCTVLVLEGRWSGSNITFGFSKCPLCKSPISHPRLKSLLDPINELREEVERKALLRLQYEGLDQSPEIREEGGIYYQNPVACAVDRHAYYQCSKCRHAYYGGDQCARRVGGADDFKPEDLVCGACSKTGEEKTCKIHGDDFIEFKCRYCCSIAIFYCFGTTHFCDTCHSAYCVVTGLEREGHLPPCPAGPAGVSLTSGVCPLNIEHPPTGEEFALGCGLCVLSELCHKRNKETRGSFNLVVFGTLQYWRSMIQPDSH